MFKNLFKKDKKSIKEENIIVLNPVDGQVVNLDKVSDEVFSKRMLGDGFAVIPTGEDVYAPVAGEVKVLFHTLHAVAIETKEGLEVLIHIGLDTVELEGKGFTAHVKLGDRVKAGDLLISFDKKSIEDSGKDSITPIVITNMDIVEELDTDYGVKKANEEVTKVKLS